MRSHIISLAEVFTKRHRCDKKEFKRTDILQKSACISLGVKAALFQWKLQRKQAIIGGSESLAGQ